MKKEIDDIFSMFDFLDEQDLLERFPRMVATETNMIQSSN